MVVQQTGFFWGLDGVYFTAAIPVPRGARGVTGVPWNMALAHHVARRNCLSSLPCYHRGILLLKAYMWSFSTLSILWNCEIQ